MGLKIERNPFTLTARLGVLALVVMHYPVRVGWAVHKWKYRGRESWTHGAAYLGRFKIMW